MTNKNSIPNRLREVREEYNEQIKDNYSKKKLSQNKKIKTLEYMADKCCVTKSVISKNETGASEPSLNTVITYADEFGVSVDYLLKRSNAKLPENFSISHELGLSDEAIKTLKSLKNTSPDLLALTNIIISGMDGESIAYYNNVFTQMCEEYKYSVNSSYYQNFISSGDSEINDAKVNFDVEKKMVYRNRSAFIESLYEYWYEVMAAKMSKLFENAIEAKIEFLQYLDSPEGIAYLDAAMEESERYIAEYGTDVWQT